MKTLKLFPWSGLALAGLLLGGCLETLPSRPQSTSVAGHAPVTWRLLERQAAYRNDHKICTRFRLPVRPHAIRATALTIEAYNDDRRYARTLWLEIDGVGGYLAADRYQRGQYSGRGVLRPGQRKHFYVNLDDVPLSIQGRASSRVNFERLLQQTGEHTLCTWISTYGQYGPGSWVTVDLQLQTDRPLPRHARLESRIWYQGQGQQPAAPRPVHRFDKKSLPGAPPATVPRTSQGERSFSKQGLLKQPLPARPGPATTPPAATEPKPHNQAAPSEKARPNHAPQPDARQQSARQPDRASRRAHHVQPKTGRQQKDRSGRPCQPNHVSDAIAGAQATKDCEPAEVDTVTSPAAPSAGN